MAAPIACVSANFFFIVVLAVVAVEVDGRAVARAVVASAAGDATILARVSVGADSAWCGRFAVVALEFDSRAVA